eukprot:TRINITY_DN14446_c0_g1_i2.p1 TRINITY_DN14446_c0_g1~~TRINITY_DN14446_c0_g1_i2.p1  ORF type:complete len:435 (-),score=44.21 TRINITY_DN14446_c0_g1_i2:2-1306(-)
MCIRDRTQRWHRRRLRILTNQMCLLDPYNYSAPTQQNHSVTGPEWVGPYADIRGRLDATYHGHYSKSRQAIQDRIIADAVGDGTSHREAPWIVFTAGAMGAGKGHVVRWMSREGYFPLPDWVQLDPDHFKACLPEWPEYVRRDRQSAGRLTQRESGYLVEIAQESAMVSRKNVWVDGSLRDTQWYERVFCDIRNRFPAYQIAILYVYAEDKVVLERVANRAANTWREVPVTEVMDSLSRVPRSIEKLGPNADFTAHISNNGVTPQLEKICCRDQCSSYPHVSWHEITSRFHTAPDLVRRASDPRFRTQLLRRIQCEIGSSRVVVFSKSYCSFSDRVKAILKQSGFVSHVIEVDQALNTVALQVELSTITDHDTMPQVFVDGDFVGGYDTILELHNRGVLTRLLPAIRTSDCASPSHDDHNVVSVTIADMQLNPT